VFERWSGRPLAIGAGPEETAGEEP
jgi:hypothetical protein